VLRALTITAIATAAIVASDASQARTLRNVTKDTPADTRQVYRDSIHTAFERCAPLHFTQGLAGAIAGRPIAVRYVENRSKEGQTNP
jgi:hypothetical protein